MIRRFKNAALSKLAAVASLFGVTMAAPADVAADTTTYFPTDAVRQQFNALINDLRYILQHQVFTSAALAIATVTSKVKSVATAVYSTSTGIFSLAATDNAWTLGVAGSNTNVATGFAQKYLLLADAAGVLTVQEGVQAATLALVTFPTQPASGKAIIGICEVVNASGAAFVPGTTLLGAAGITTTFKNGVNTDVLLATRVRP